MDGWMERMKRNQEAGASKDSVGASDRFGLGVTTAVGCGMLGGGWWPRRTRRDCGEESRVE
jgi:hypothetical protein